IGLIVNNRLEREGFMAFPIPASQRTGENKEGGIFSHRMAAQMAGLGWIGKNCSLVSPQNGPRLRLATVLTNAPLEPDHPMENRCGGCTKCRDICPAGAILGKTFDADDDLSQRFDFFKCDSYLSETRQTFGKRICGRCVAVCPYGKK
ncbi:MAG: 4Fe-4S double cluster binding domain-containing protein, partial [Bacillota bacterium]|nr:4Fe-4S double cluster binding domain-containing protein [Bacillota bacterium]